MLAPILVALLSSCLAMTRITKSDLFKLSKSFMTFKSSET
jgi:hypothetical protein